MGSSAEMAAYAAGSSGTAAKGWTVDVIGCTRELLEEGAMGHKAVGQISWVEALLPDGIGRQSVPAADRRPSRLAAPYLVPEPVAPDEDRASGLSAAGAVQGAADVAAAGSTAWPSPMPWLASK